MGPSKHGRSRCSDRLTENKVSKAPHIIWPAAIIGLLLLSVVTTFAIMWASQSDGGAQVVDDYYRKSVAWDSLAAVRDASELLGWSVAISLEGSDKSRQAVVTVTDSSDTPLERLSGSVTVTRPQSIASFGDFSLEEVDETKGLYRFSFPFSGRGLWDLDFRIQQADIHYSTTVRIEI